MFYVVVVDRLQVRHKIGERAIVGDNIHRLDNRVEFNEWSQTISIGDGLSKMRA